MFKTVTFRSYFAGSTKLILRKEKNSFKQRCGFLVYAKGKQSNRRQTNPSQNGSMEQYLPPVDPDNEQFVIYVRSKRGLKTWFPLNVVTGGSTANTLVRGLDSSLSREMAVKSLSNNIGQALYKEKEKLEELVRKMPMLKSCKEFEFGFCVLDKKNPSSMFKPLDKDVFIIPREEDTQLPVQKVTTKLKNMGDSLKNLFEEK